MSHGPPAEYGFQNNNWIIAHEPAITAVAAVGTTSAYNFFTCQCQLPNFPAGYMENNCHQ